MGQGPLGSWRLNIQFGHYVDALCLCVGEISEVSAVLSTQVPKWYFTDIEETMDVTTPDNVLVSGKLANCAVVSVHVDSIPWHGSDPQIQVFGREGTMAYHGSHINAWKGREAQILPCRRVYCDLLQSP